MITFDTASSSGNTTGTTGTLAHTIGSGSNRILLVGVLSFQNGTSASGVTYNGTPLTQAALYNPGGGTGVTLELWYLLNPAVGTHNIVVTFPTSQTMEIGGASFFGAAQTAPTDGTHNATGNGSSISNSISTTTDNDLVFDIAYQGRNISPAQTDASWTNNVNGGNKQLQASYQISSTHGSYNNTWTGAGGFDWFDTILAIKPFVPTSTDNSLFFAGH